MGQNLCPRQGLLNHKGLIRERTVSYWRKTRQRSLQQTTARSTQGEED